MPPTKVKTKTWESFEDEHGKPWWIAKLKGAYLDESWFWESDPSWDKTIITTTTTTATTNTPHATANITITVKWTNGHESFKTTDGRHGTSC